MMIDNRTVVTVILLVVLALFSSTFADAVGSGALDSTQRGLVPCGGEGQPRCSPCHAFVLVQNIYNFIIGIPPYFPGLMIPIATLMFIYGGFLMVFPGFGGSADALTRGKKVITNTLIGIAVILFAWLAVDTIIKILMSGGQQLGSGTPAQVLKSEERGVKLGPWNAITCNVPTSAKQTPEVQASILAPGTAGVTAGVLSGIANELKKKAIFSSSADCRDTSGNQVSAQTTINELSSGQPVTVCSSGCTGKSVCSKSNLQVNGTMLAALDSAAKSGLKFTVTSITTGSHSSASCHYAGNCVDIIPANKSDYDALKKKLNDLGGEALCEGKSGTLYNNCFGTAHDPINHVHARFR